VSNVEYSRREVNRMTRAPLTDVNECSVDNGGCQHACDNSMGSFQCICPPGYRLAKDKRSCEGELSTNLVP
jgi:hypothetical protein